MTPRHGSSSVAPASRRRELPSGYTSVKDILSESVSIGRLVNVIGLVQDRRLPMATTGSDWKSALTIYDKSVEDEYNTGLLFTIFRPENEIPQPDAGDVVVITSVKVQNYRNEVSLLCNQTTTIRTYAASEIPKPPKSAKIALQPPCRGKDRDRDPGDKEHDYVSWLYHSVSKDRIPDAAAFNIQVEQSRQVKDKFSKLEAVCDGRFCDVIVNVVKDPFDMMDKATLWVSDYTENDSFYKFSWNGPNESEGREGDPYGYVNTSIPATRNWPGPYGKRSIQVTCFEPHAEFVMSEVKAGMWVRLRNLHIKFGHNGNNLEGFLRTDHSGFHGGQVQVDVLETNDRKSADQRLKDAIGRKFDYAKLLKKQQKSFTTDNDGNKRKAEDTDERKKNSKQKRKALREAAQRKVEEQDKKAEEMLGLNELIKSESLDEPITPVSSIIEPIPWTTTIGGQEVTLTLPFANAKYRANVRVVDFRPSKLENFASWRQNTEYDMLSNCSGGSEDESDDDDDDDRDTLDRYTGPKTWEWRFALQLEEADPRIKGVPGKFWAVVDNTEAQQLTGLDASDLRAHPDDLHALRETLFKLWGNLEELKQQRHQAQLQAQKRIALHQPPPESSPPDDDDGAANNNTGILNNKNDSTNSNSDGKASNKPFGCCVRQYGVKMRESDPRRADAGEGWRWERMFGLFGTKIRS